MKSDSQHSKSSVLGYNTCCRLHVLSLALLFIALTSGSLYLSTVSCTEITNVKETGKTGNIDDNCGYRLFDIRTATDFSLNSTHSTVPSVHITETSAHSNTTSELRVRDTDASIYRIFSLLRRSGVLTFSKQPPLYYIFALHRMRD